MCAFDAKRTSSLRCASLAEIRPAETYERVRGRSLHMEATMTRLMFAVGVVLVGMSVNLQPANAYTALWCL